jgi:hypothetical protein
VAVVFAAAVFVPQVAVAQVALVAVPPASQLERVRGGPRAAQLVAQVAQQGARRVPDALLVVRSDASLVDLRGALPEPDASPVAHSDAQSAVHSVASQADPQGGQQDDYLAVRSADGR